MVCYRNLQLGSFAALLPTNNCNVYLLWMSESLPYTLLSGFNLEHHSLNFLPKCQKCFLLSSLAVPFLCEIQSAGVVPWKKCWSHLAQCQVFGFLSISLPVLLFYFFSFFFFLFYSLPTSVHLHHLLCFFHIQVPVLIKKHDFFTGFFIQICAD